MYKQIEQTITSIEVAKMVEKPHNDLLKDIRRYLEQLGQGNISQSDFFTESTYQNKQNKTQPCYQITKKGCEFIAHKLTGTKGTIFTARYINRFHEMEDIIADRKTGQPWFIRKFNGKYIILFRDFEFITGVNVKPGNPFWKAHGNELIGGLDWNGWGWYTTVDKKEFNKKYGFNYGDDKLLEYFYPCGAVKALEILKHDRTVQLYSEAYETLNKGISMIQKLQNKRSEVKTEIVKSPTDSHVAIYEAKYAGFKDGFLCGIELMQKN